MSANRRRFARVKPARLVCRVTVDGAAHPGLRVENLSMVGVFVETTLTPPLRARCQVELPIAGSRTPLLLEGHVAAVVPRAKAALRGVVPGFAVEFDPHPPPHVELRLERLIADIDPGALKRLDGAPAVTPPGGAPKAPSPAPPRDELATLRALAASQETEIRQLRNEVERLRAKLRQVLGP